MSALSIIPRGLKLVMDTCLCVGIDGIGVGVNAYRTLTSGCPPQFLSIFYNILYYVILSSLPLEPRAIDSASVSPQIPLWIPCLHLLAIGNMSELPCPPGTYLGAEDLDSGPHTCVANTVLTESSRQSKFPHL